MLSCNIGNYLIKRQNERYIIMFNINAFYRTDVSKLHYLVLFLQKQLKKNGETCFVSCGPN